MTETPRPLTGAECDAIDKLEALKGDSESAHGEADNVLLDLVHPLVKEAWLNAEQRVTFWYA